MYKILVVDDDAQMLGLLGQLLEREGYQVLSASTASQTIRMIEHETPNLFIIDARLPGMDGLSLCRHVRKHPRVSRVPIVIITGHDSTYSLTEALEAGADDFVRKPFPVRELTARLRAHLRRARHAGGEEHLPFIEIFPQTRLVLVDQRRVDLTQVEFELLSYMCAAPARMHSTQELLMNVWHYPSDTGDTALVRNHIRNLRRKLEDSPERPEIIQSRHGRGYTVKARVQVVNNIVYRSA